MINRKNEILNKGDYNAALIQVDTLMKKGEINLKPAELKKLRSLAEALEVYEDTYLPMPTANSIPELIEIKMFERKINQVQLAKMLGIKAPKLSQILNGKRGPDIQFLKAIYTKLNIDAKFLLEKV